jgi:hypothetical protein
VPGGLLRSPFVPTCVQCKTDLAFGARICASCRALQPLASHGGPIAEGSTIDLGYGRIVV